jgi:hypothetical protein
VPRKYETCQ